MPTYLLADVPAFAKARLLWDGEDTVHVDISGLETYPEALSDSGKFAREIEEALPGFMEKHGVHHILGLLPGRPAWSSPWISVPSTIRDGRECARIMAIGLTNGLGYIPDEYRPPDPDAEVPPGFSPDGGYVSLEERLAPVLEMYEAWEAWQAESAKTDTPRVPPGWTVPDEEHLEALMRDEAARRGVERFREELAASADDLGKDAVDFTLGMLDALSDASGDFTYMVAQSLGGTLYWASGGLTGSKSAYRHLQDLQKQISAIPWHQLIDGALEAPRRAMDDALRALDRADTPRETGKALMELLDVASMLFGPEFAARRLSLPHKPEILPQEIRPPGMEGRAVSRAEIGMEWGKGVQLQGMPAEDFIVLTKIGEQNRLPKNFPVFDGFVEAPGAAYSVKTLDTITVSRMVKPGQLYSTLKGYVDKMVHFQEGSRGGTSITKDMIRSKTLELVLPSSTMNEQLIEIGQAMRYAEEVGVKVTITYVRN